MWGFSFNWVLIIFLLQVMSFGITMGKLGDVKVSTYSPGLLLLNLVFAIMSGLSLLWWPS